MIYLYMYIYYIYITYINVGCYYTYSPMLSYIALYNMTTNTNNIRMVVCANTKGHLLDPPLTRNLITPCLLNVENIFHHASSKVIIKNFSQQISRKCKIKLRASFTQHFRERRLGRLGVEALSITLTELEAIGDTRR